MAKWDSKQEWLLLIHQLPPKPTSLRVRVWRKLQKLGAVSLKNSVYVLPFGEKTHEDFQWVKQEVESAGGEATVLRAGSVEGATDDELASLFRAQRAEEYARVTAELAGLAGAVRGQRKGGHLSPGRLNSHEADLSRLHQELERVVAVDFFLADGRAAALAALGRCREALHLPQDGAGRGAKGRASKGGGLDTAQYQGRRWVTRKNPHIDRLATAWLIRRFIDKRPRFLFVEDGTRVEGGIHYDMADAEFTHRGEDCTFETVVKEFGLAGDPALGEIAEIVHDIDLKDGKFNRLEASGINLAVRGLASVVTDDRKLVRQAATVFDGLYEYLTDERAKGERDGGGRKGGGGKKRARKAGRK
ncbi:MAG: chromate resistance protein [Acidobacteria bacterium]|nr:chromate resistance protein [Acidobacteriota bacterium]